MISESQGRALITAGENQYTEFKTSVPRPSNLARVIAGFANTTGGQILIGVGENPTVEEAIHGVDPTELRHHRFDRLDVPFPILASAPKPTNNPASKANGSGSTGGL